MDQIKFVMLCAVLTSVPHMEAYATVYTQPDANANVTPQLPLVPQPAYNVPYPPKSAYSYPQMMSAQKPSVLYIDPQSYQYLYGADQPISTTTAPPSGIWKIFSEFSLPNWFARQPEETSTDYSSNPYAYQPPSPAPYPYSQPNDQSSYYNYAIYHQPSPSGAPPSGNYQYQYQSYSKYPLHQVPAPGSKSPILPPVGRYPANYYNNYPYAPTASPNPTTPSLVSLPIQTTTTSVPVSEYPSISKPGYPQGQLPAYSIYLVPAKPGYYPPQGQSNPSNQGSYNPYGRPAASYPVQQPSTYYNSYVPIDGYYNKNPFYPVTTVAPVLTTTGRTAPGSDCNNTKTTPSVAYPAIYKDPIDIRNNEKKDNDVDVSTTPIPFTTMTAESTTIPPSTTTTAAAATTTAVEPVITEISNSSSEGSAAQARYLFSQEDQENNWVPLVPAV